MSKKVDLLFVVFFLLSSQTPLNLCEASMTSKYVVSLASSSIFLWAMHTYKSIVPHGWYPCSIVLVKFHSNMLFHPYQKICPFQFSAVNGSQPSSFCFKSVQHSSLTVTHLSLHIPFKHKSNVMARRCKSRSWWRHVSIILKWVQKAVHWDNASKCP